MTKVTQAAKINKTEQKAINSAVKNGFTWRGESFFASYEAGKRCINSLLRRGFLVFVANEYGGQFEPTQKARDFVTHGLDVSI